MVATAYQLKQNDIKKIESQSFWTVKELRKIKLKDGF